MIISKKIKQLLKVYLPLVIGLFLLAYSYFSTSPEERLKIWVTIKNADFFWISISLLFGFISNYSRALRWKYMLIPLGCKPRITNSFFAVMFGYLSNLGIPRSGEVLRGATLATYENISFDKSFGTIVAERVVDMLMLLLIIGVTVLMQADEIFQFFTDYSVNLWFGIVGLIFLLILFYIFLRLIRHLEYSFIKKIKPFFEGLWEGIISISRMKHKKLFIFHTLLIWGMYIAIFWVTKYSIPATEHLNAGAILVAFIAGSFSISVTSGGIGLYPIAVAYSLFFFGVDKESGEAFGWILWSSQTLLVVVLGVISVIFLPIVNKKRLH